MRSLVGAFLLAILFARPLNAQPGHDVDVEMDCTGSLQNFADDVPIKKEPEATAFVEIWGGVVDITIKPYGAITANIVDARGKY